MVSQVWFIAILPFILISNKQRIYQSLICTKIPEQEQYRQNEEKHSGGYLGKKMLFALKIKMKKKIFP